MYKVAKFVISAVLVLRGGQILSGQSATVTTWDCNPNKQVNSCREVVTTKNGSAFSHMYGSCTNSQYLDIQPAAFAHSCTHPVTISASTTKAPNGFSGDGHPGSCTPDFTVYQDCTESEPFKSGGCEGPC